MLCTYPQPLIPVRTPECREQAYKPAKFKSKSLKVYLVLSIWHHFTRIIRTFTVYLTSLRIYPPLGRTEKNNRFRVGSLST